MLGTVPYTFPVNWGLGDANLNYSSYQVAAGACVQHLRVTGHALAYTTRKRTGKLPSLVICTHTTLQLLVICGLF